MTKFCSKRKAFIKLYDGECISKDCKQYCPDVYAPVCGQAADGSTKIFGNGCELEVANCPIKSKKFSEQILYRFQENRIFSLL
jgi:hypothetical protein